LLESQPLRGAMAFSADGDRLAFDMATDPPSGDLAVENVDRGLADEVPGDAIYYSEAGNLGASFTALIGPMKDAVAATPEGEEQIAMIEAALGADLEDLVSWIDDGATVIGFADGELYGGLLLVPNDVEAAERRLSQLSSFAALAALDPESGVTVEEAEVESRTVTTIRWQDAGGLAENLLPMPPTAPSSASASRSSDGCSASMRMTRSALSPATPTPWPISAAPRPRRLPGSTLPPPVGRSRRRWVRRSTASTRPASTRPRCCRGSTRSIASCR
jgi:hypothetical protein